MALIYDELCVWMPMMEFLWCLCSGREMRDVAA